MVYHNLQLPTSVQSHTRTSAYCNINITVSHKKKNNVMNTMSTHSLSSGTKDKTISTYCRLLHRCKHEKDEATFDCSINFKGFYTIKHNLSSSYYIPSLLYHSCFSLIFLLHEQNFCILITCMV